MIQRTRQTVEKTTMLSSHIWKFREALYPLFSTYDAYTVGLALVRMFEAEGSRGLCGQVAQVVNALTDFEVHLDYLDFYVHFEEDQPQVKSCLRCKILTD